MLGTERKKLALSELLIELEQLEDKIRATFADNGDNALVSDAELLGTVNLLHHDLVMAVHGGDPQAIITALKEMAVGSIHGITSIRENTKRVH